MTRFPLSQTTEQLRRSLGEKAPALCLPDGHMPDEADAWALYRALGHNNRLYPAFRANGCHMRGKMAMMLLAAMNVASTLRFASARTVPEILPQLRRCVAPMAPEGLLDIAESRAGQQIKWRHHFAVSVEGRDESGTKAEWVLDPVVFAGPMRLEDWRASLGAWSVETEAFCEPAAPGSRWDNMDIGGHWLIRSLNVMSGEQVSAMKIDEIASELGAMARRNLPDCLEPGCRLPLVPPRNAPARKPGTQATGGPV